MPKTFSEVYRPKSPDEQKFVDKHVTIKHADRNGNSDDLFNAKNIKKVKRNKERHGYETGEDAKVYEANIDEGLKAIVSLKKDDGSYHEVGTNNRTIFSGSESSIKKKAKEFAKGKSHRIEYHHSNNFYAKPHKTTHINEDLETIEASLLEYFDEVGQEVSYEELQELAVELQGEVLSELSGSTLGSYIAKSTSDEKKRREKGIETRDKIRAQTGLNVGTPMDRKLYSPVASRKAGRTRAIAKLTGGAKVNVKEETLDELSNQTLKSYIKKAGRDAANHDDSAEQLMKRSKFRRKKSKLLNVAATHAIKSVKRTNNIIKAVNKLTKENLDNIINRYNQEEITIEEALVEKIAHLSEKHQALILTLFDTLSEDNQELLFHTLDEEDGINETIDFALDAQLNEANSYEVEAEHKDGHTKSRSYFAKSSTDAKSQFHQHHSKDEYSVKKVTRLKEETLDEISSSRNLDSIKRANHNITNLSKGIKPEVKKTLTWKQHMASYDKEEKAKYHEHKAHYEHHKAELKDLHNTYKDLHSGNLGISKDDKVGQQGAEEEIESMKDHHRAKLTYHLNKMHYHNSNLSKPLKIKEEVEHLDELSNSTLKSYITKASNQAFSRAYAGSSMITRGDYIGDKDEEKAGQKNVQKGIRRVSGIAKAVRKLKEEALDESCIAGTKKISSHEGKNGHTHEIRYDRDNEEYSVHHYKDGKHLGEGPVSYHSDKEEAQDQVAYDVKNFKR